MATAKWTLDQTHSEIQFKVKHLMITTVTGQFNQFTATVEMEEDNISTAKINFNAEVDSIYTNNAQRDAHLKANDFFDAANHPQLIFHSDKVQSTDDENYKLHGTLTIKGVSRPVILNVDYGGVMQDPWGNTRMGVTVTGKINRQDFGISMNMITETGGIMLSDEVKLHCSVQFVKQAELVPA
jgi:polyisoprenoid-binding protein YceI